MGKKGGKVRIKQVGPKGAPTNPLADFAVPPDEMIHLPPKPDPNISHIWPMSETFTMKYDRFHAIYPSYLDSTKTVKLGRRISSTDAIADPSVFEIGEALKAMNVQHVVQPYKGYSRDTESRWYNPGRVLIDLDRIRDAGGIGGTLGSGVDGSYDLDDVPHLAGEGDGDGDRSVTKKRLCREIARRIPSMPSRIKRMEEKRKAEEEKRKSRERAAALARSGGGSGGASSAGTGHKKKKGKKKR